MKTMVTSMLSTRRAAAAGSDSRSLSARRYAMTPRSESGTVPSIRKITRSRALTLSLTTPVTVLTSPSGKNVGSSLRQRRSVPKKTNAVETGPATNVMPKICRSACVGTNRPWASGSNTPQMRPAIAQPQAVISVIMYGSCTARRRASRQSSASFEPARTRTSGRAQRVAQAAPITSNVRRPATKNGIVPCSPPGRPRAMSSMNLKYEKASRAPMRFASIETKSRHSTRAARIRGPASRPLHRARPGGSCRPRRPRSSPSSCRARTRRRGRRRSPGPPRR